LLNSNFTPFLLGPNTLKSLTGTFDYSKNKKLKLFDQVVRIIKGKGWG